MPAWHTGAARRPAVRVLAALLLLATGGTATGCWLPAAGGDPTPASAAGPGATATVPFRVLQMNLCNGCNEPACYRGGQAIDEAAELIADTGPDMVTVQEVCGRDVTERLAAALDDASSGEVVHAFAARTHRDGSPLTCPDGDELGVGVLVAAPTREHQVFTDLYVTQAANDNMRPYACLYTAGHRYACTTHLTSTNRSVAVGQCEELLDEIVPAMQAEAGPDLPVVVAADFNLWQSASPQGVDSCVPDGWSRRGDDDVQHVLTSGHGEFTDSRVLPMRFTDHPALLAELAVEVDTDDTDPGS